MIDKKIDVMWDDAPVDVSTEVNFIWSIANKLRGTYQSDKYKDVIIPMVIIRRFESIEDYMAREVLPHVPDAQWFFEEDLGKKNPVVKTGAEIPFTRYFYKYSQPKPSEELEQRFLELEKSVSERIARLFGGDGNA